MDPVTEFGQGPLDGVVIHPLKMLEDERGAILHMLRADSPLASRWGEVYFSEVKPGVVKAWKCHARMTQRLAVPIGRVKFVLYDDRRDSRTMGRINVWVLGRPLEYRLLIIPPSIWYGFQGVDSGPSLIANCPDLPHDPAEMERANWNTESIPYRWRDEPA